MTTRFRFPCTRRLSGAKAFARVFELRCSASDARLVIYAAPNGLPYLRMGLSVSRKLGPAVQRNRIKRLIREAFRLEQHELPAGIDFVVVPRVGRTRQLEEYRKSWLELAPRAASRARKQADMGSDS